VAGCPRTPAECRRKCVAGKLDNAKLGANGRLNANCPRCGSRGFTISPPDRVPSLRHIWCCLHCHASASDLRRALVGLGIATGCLGTYGREKPAGTPDGLTASLAARIEDIITDPKLRTISDLRIRVAEVLWGEAPSGYREFVRFAVRAGVSRSKAYDTAARWGRRSATSRLSKLRPACQASQVKRVLRCPVPGQSRPVPGQIRGRSVPFRDNGHFGR
jgi:hypothetical protein